MLWFDSSQLRVRNSPVLFVTGDNVELDHGLWNFLPLWKSYLFIYLKLDLSSVWRFNSEKLLMGEFARGGVSLAVLWRGSSALLFCSPLVVGICLPPQYLIFTLFKALIYHLKWLSFPLVPYHVQISMSCHFCLTRFSSRCLAVVPKLPHSNKPHWRDLC